MEKGVWFWIIFVICVLFGFYCYMPSERTSAGWWRPLGGNLVVFILIFILGWAVFGPPIR